MKPVYFGILLGAFGLLLVITTRTKADSVPPGTVFDLVVDVRTANEFREYQVPGAVNIDVSEGSFNDQILKLNREKTYGVYCRSGARSGSAKTIMTKLGFKNVINLGSVAQAEAKLKKKRK